MLCRRQLEPQPAYWLSGYWCLVLRANSYSMECITHDVWLLRIIRLCWRLRTRYQILLSSTVDILKFCKDSQKMPMRIRNYWILLGLWFNPPTDKNSIVNNRFLNVAALVWVVIRICLFLYTETLCPRNLLPVYCVFIGHRLCKQCDIASNEPWTA